MFFDINPHNGVAIYDQIARQVKFAVASSALRSGDLVPSVRELARELGINPNTVARAYRQLQDDGVLDNVRGTGLEVAKGAAERCRAQRVRIIRQRLRHVLEEAKQSQLELSEVRALIEKELASWDKVEKS
jgi:GntR family transcriptional regulator